MSELCCDPRLHTDPSGKNASSFFLGGVASKAKVSLRKDVVVYWILGENPVRLGV